MIQNNIHYTLHQTSIRDYDTFDPKPDSSYHENSKILEL